MTFSPSASARLVPTAALLIPGAESRVPLPITTFTSVVKLAAVPCGTLTEGYSFATPIVRKASPALGCITNALIVEVTPSAARRMKATRYALCESSALV